MYVRQADARSGSNVAVKKNLMPKHITDLIHNTDTLLQQDNK